MNSIDAGQARYTCRGSCMWTSFQYRTWRVGEQICYQSRRLVCIGAVVSPQTQVQPFARYLIHAPCLNLAWLSQFSHFPFPSAPAQTFGISQHVAPPHQRPRPNNRARGPGCG